MSEIASVPKLDRKRNVHKGFTLLELLVVIAMLALLIGMMVPSLKRAREQAKDTQCRTNLHAVYIATVTYLHDWEKFPELNNEPQDGAWQYNYLIYDGRDFEENFGPIVASGNLESIELLFCPRQMDPYHSFATAENPWPVIPLLDTRSGYARKNNLSGRFMSQLKGNPAIMADIFHLPKVIKSAHKKGVNVAHLGGDVNWVADTGFLSDNELTHPFQPEDNDLIENIWDHLSRGAQ